MATALRMTEEQKTKRRKEVRSTISCCERFLVQLTEKETEKQMSKIRLGKSLGFLGNALSSLLEGVSLKEAEKLAKSVESIFSGGKSKKDIQEVVEAFPLDLIKDYGEKLTDPDESIKVLRSQYKESEESMRRGYYEQLKSVEWSPSLAEVSGSLALDTENGLEGGNLRFPMLDFYRMLLMRYDEQRPSGVFGKPGLADIFVITMQKFLEVSHHLAANSDSFESFDAKMDSLKSFEIPVVQR